VRNAAPDDGDEPESNTRGVEAGGGTRTTTMIYAGIGSRNTPDNIIDKMIAIGEHLAHKGWSLRSGGADGADHAFEHGCDNAGGNKEIWLPWKGFNGSKSEFVFTALPAETRQRALLIASQLHPNWEACLFSARQLHGRNVLQILGADFETPVDRVICWTPAGAFVGGTATALRLAKQYSIPIVNLANASPKT
jgi:hypothetical protein